MDLGLWAQLFRIAARITGLAQADLQMNEPLAAGIPARVRGSIAIVRLGVADGRQEILGARRIEASGLELHWSGGEGRASALRIGRVEVTNPRGVVERDRSGDFPLQALSRRADAT